MLPAGPTPVPGQTPRIPPVVREPPRRYARRVNQTHRSSDSSHPADPPERLSLLAAASFLMAVLGVSGCLGISWLAYARPDRFLFLGVVPVLALGAVVCGALARRQIGRSGGALRGRGLATFGILVGVMGGVIPTAFLLSAMVTLSSLKSLAPVTERVVLAAAAQKPQSARSDLSPVATGEITDARLNAIGAAIEAAIGAPTHADVTIGAIGESRKKVGALASGGDPSALGDLSPKPVVIRCARGNLFVFVILDEGALNQGRVLLDDALIVLPGDSGLTLRPQGPARDVALALGVPIREIQE